MIKKPLISVIIPVYNVEKYLEETIKSVLRQDIRFKENIELILVNDGSSDQSESIILNYKDMYPDNVVYIKQKNSGVSVARNRGLRVARGKYVNFLDSDDMISRNAYSDAIELLEINKNSIEFVAMKIEFFDARLGGHPLNNKFSNTRVIDVNKEPDAVIMHMPTCIIKRSAIKTEFVKKIEISEDARFISEILLRKKAYGVLSSSIYYYRKRSTGGSAIDLSQKKASFYNVTPRDVYAYIVDIWTDAETGLVHPYAQNLLVYDLQWRIRQNKQSVLLASEVAEYKKAIYSLIKRIDSDVIVSRSFLSIAEKEFMLGIKGEKNKKYREILRRDYKNTKREISIDVIEFNKNNLVFMLHVPGGSSVTDVAAIVNGRRLKPDHYTSVGATSFLGDQVYDGGGMIFKVGYGDLKRDLYFTDNGVLCRIITQKHSRIPSSRGGYVLFKDRLIVNKVSQISFYNYSITHHVIRELLWCIRILCSIRLNDSLKEVYRIMGSTMKSKIPAKSYTRPILVPVKALLLNIRDVAIRALYYLEKIFASRPVWIVSDRIDMAGDNGEAFFKYLSLNKGTGSEHKVFFSLDARSELEYTRMKSIGRTVNRLSFRYKRLFLRADKIISSHAEDAVYNAFGGRYNNFLDLYRFDFVFLQHGITKDDLSGWLKKPAKNIRLFVTSTDQEKKSIIDGDYMYSDREVILTGLPRYDYLKDQQEKLIVIMPTWRTSIVPPMNQNTGKRKYAEEFKESEFYTFFNGLINDKKLIGAMSKHGYKGEFYIHPSLSSQVGDFRGNDIIKVMHPPHSYADALARGQILLTDYSSIAFDFVYMKKPVVYSQFDRDTFFEGQVYSEGYFSYEKDGFGPVLYDYADTLRTLTDYIQHGGSIESKYLGRIDKFFRFNDRNNSRRVYEQILKLGRYDKKSPKN